MNDKDMNVELENDLTLPGSNTKLLAVRMPQYIYNALENLAKRDSKSIPEIVRTMIYFHLFPPFVKYNISNMKNEELAERYKDFSKFEHYERIVDNILNDCEQVVKVKNVVLEKQKKMEELKKEYENEFNSLSKFNLDNDGIFIKGVS